MNPAQPMQGQYVTIDITVRNRGQAHSSACYLEWYEHLDVPPLLYQFGSIWTLVPDLAPSATYTVSFGYAFIAEGDFNMYVQIDSAASAGESIEDNNIYGPYGYHVAEGCVGTLSPLGRWCDQNNGTVKDMTTGLVWLRDAGWGEAKAWREEGDYLQNNDAHTRAGTLYDGMAGEPSGLSDGSVEGDWRLPTKSELVGIMTGDEYIRSSQMYFFTNVQSYYYYWSGTSYALNPYLAWSVSMSGGGVQYSHKYFIYYVWPVRSDN